jgi:hypothetical protein
MFLLKLLTVWDARGKGVSLGLAARRASETLLDGRKGKSCADATRWPGISEGGY